MYVGSKLVVCINLKRNYFSADFCKYRYAIIIYKENFKRFLKYFGTEQTKDFSNFKMNENGGRTTTVAIQNIGNIFEPINMNDGHDDILIESIPVHS